MVRWVPHTEGTPAATIMWGRSQAPSANAAPNNCIALASRTSRTHSRFFEP